MTVSDLRRILAPLPDDFKVIFTDFDVTSDVAPTRFIGVNATIPMVTYNKVLISLERSEGRG